MSPSSRRMPLLASGSHLDETDGACLMEFASILAGERFSDRPRCSDPVLADLVRAVNDEMSTDGRQQLAMTAPVLVGLVGDDRIAPAVVAAAADVALTRTRRPAGPPGGCAARSAGPVPGSPANRPLDDPASDGWAAGREASSMRAARPTMPSPALSPRWPALPTRSGTGR